MSLISEQIQKLRDLANYPEIDMYGIRELNDAFEQAADTIEALSTKLYAANMERSSAYYNNDDDMNDVMIRSARNAKRTTRDAIDAYNERGLGGVYNLGQKDMYEYLTKQ